MISISPNKRSPPSSTFACAMEDLIFYVGVLGNVVSLLVFCSPVNTFWRIVRKKSTESFKGIPYTTTLLSTLMWTYYGLLNPNGLLVVTVNGTGSVLQSIYVVLYIIYSPREIKVKMLRLLILNMVVYSTVVEITFFGLRGSPRLTLIGVTCACLTVGMYASPMAAMREVVKTKSVKYMPFFLSLFLFLNGGIWSTYSYLVGDYFIGVPNALGFLLGSAQLALYAFFYKKTTQSTRETGELDEEVNIEHLIIQIDLQERGGDHQPRQRPLGKGSSLPKPTTTIWGEEGLNFSLGKIARSHSTPHDLISLLPAVPNVVF